MSIIGRTRTNQPVESTEELDNKLEPQYKGYLYQGYLIASSGDTLKVNFVSTVNVDLDTLSENLLPFFNLVRGTIVEKTISGVSTLMMVNEVSDITSWFDAIDGAGLEKASLYGNEYQSLDI